MNNLNALINNFSHQTTASLISDINSLAFQEKIFGFKLAVVIAGLILLIAIIYLFLRTNWLKFLFWESFVEFFTLSPYGIKKMNKSWLKIIARLDTFLESEYKVAVVEADDMLDNGLKKLGYAGKDLDERLNKMSPTILSNIEDLREAHKTRGLLVTDPNFRVDLDRTQKILDTYKQALQKLQIL